jgi:hypothetical protein
MFLVRDGHHTSLLPRNGLAAFDVNGGRGKTIAPAKALDGQKTLPLDPRGPGRHVVVIGRGQRLQATIREVSSKNMST